MIMSIKDLVHYHRGLKEGALHVLELAMFGGMNEFIKKSQEFINAAEYNEIRLTVEAQKNSNPPGDCL